MTSPSTPSPVLARYLDQLAQGLADCGLPPEERAEIAREIESHLADAGAAGTPLAEGIRRLGSPQELARTYAVELLLRPPTPPRRQTWRRGVAAFTSAVTSLLTYAIAFALLVLGGGLAIAGLLGVLGGLFAPWLPLEPTLRTGLPQVVVLLTSLALGALGFLLLRLVRTAWRIAHTRPRSLHPSTKENHP